MSLRPVIIPFSASKENSYVLEITHKKIRLYTQHGQVIKDDEVYEIDCPYTQDELFTNNISNIQYVQNGDMLYLFHKNHPIQVVSRNSTNSWTIKNFNLKNGPFGEVSSEEATLSYNDNKIISTLGVFESSDVGRLIRLTVVNDTTKAWVAEDDVEALELRKSDGKVYKNIDGTKTGTTKPVHTEGSQSDGGVIWEYQHSGYATFTITKFIDANTVEVTTNDIVPIELESGTEYYEMGLFYEGSPNPISGCFFRNRFCFLVNIDNVPHICMSCSDDYNNFADKDNGEVLATNAITVKAVSSKYNVGGWLCAMDTLFVGTSTGEFLIDSATSSEALAPDNVKVQLISEIGSLPIPPVIVGSHVLFVTNKGTSIRDLLYSFTEDSYDPIELSLFGRHLLTSGITSMCYQENPDKIVWFTLNDGRLIGLTFSSEQKVQAMHQHNLGGSVYNLAVIPNPSFNFDDLWCVVDRNGDYSIEWLDNGIVTEYPNEINSTQNLDLKEELENKYMLDRAFYLDSALSIDRNIDEYIGTVEVDGEEKTNIYVLIDDVPYMLNEVASTFDIPFNRHKNKVIKVAFDTQEGIMHSVKFPVIMQGAFLREFGQDRTVTATQTEFKVGYLQIVPLDVQTTSNTVRVEFEIRNILIDEEEIELFGLNHLEGKEVGIIADGSERERQIVKNGSVKISSYDNVVTVGLPIESVYIPQTMYFNSGNGMGVGDVQRIDSVTLMLWRSMGGKIGDKYNNLIPLYYRKTDEKMNKATPLFSGNKTTCVDFNNSTIEERGAKLIIHNDSVFPMNILAIAPHISTSGNGL